MFLMCHVHVLCKGMHQPDPPNLRADESDYVSGMTRLIRIEYTFFIKVVLKKICHQLTVSHSHGAADSFFSGTTIPGLTLPDSEINPRCEVRQILKRALVSLEC